MELLPPALYAAAFIATLLSATVQGTAGFGFATISVPMLSLIDPRLAPAPQLLLALPMTALMLWRGRKHLEIRGAMRVLIGRLPGNALGLWLVTLADQSVLDLLVAFCVFVAVGIMASKRQLLPRNPGTEFGAGIVSGTMSSICSMGGPPMALVFKDSKGPIIRANLAFIFTIGMTITALLRARAGELTRTDWMVTIQVFPAVLLGLLISRWLAPRVEGARLKLLIMGIATFAALGLTFRGVSGLLG